VASSRDKQQNPKTFYLSGLSDAKAIMVLNLEGSLKAGLAAIVRYIEGTHLLELFLYISYTIDIDNKVIQQHSFLSMTDRSSKKSGPNLTKLNKKVKELD
jgi:hypothetical protein